MALSCTSSSSSSSSILNTPSNPNAWSIDTRREEALLEFLVGACVGAVLYLVLPSLAQRMHLRQPHDQPLFRGALHPAVLASLAMPPSAIELRLGALASTMADELWLHVLAFMTPFELLRCRLVSRRWRALATDRALWRRLCWAWFGVDSAAEESRYRAPITSRGHQQQSSMWYFFTRLARERAIQQQQATRTALQQQQHAAHTSRLERYRRHLASHPHVTRPCARCSELFAPADVTRASCVFHDGRFNDLLGEWTCCPAQSRDARGCQQRGQHQALTVDEASLPRLIELLHLSDASGDDERVAAAAAAAGTVATGGAGSQFRGGT